MVVTKTEPDSATIFLERDQIPNNLQPDDIKTRKEELER